MKKHFKFTIFLVSLLVLFCLSPVGANAQPDANTEFGDPDAEVPIDGGLGLLVAAGIGYGVKKWREEKHKKVKQLF